MLLYDKPFGPLSYLKWRSHFSGICLRLIMCSEGWFQPAEPCREVSQSFTQWNKSFQFSLSAILKLRKLALMLAVPT